MASFSSLPVELVEQIAKFVSRTSNDPDGFIPEELPAYRSGRENLKALRLVNRKCNQAAWVVWLARTHLCLSNEMAKEVLQLPEADRRQVRHLIVTRSSQNGIENFEQWRECLQADPNYEPNTEIDAPGVLDPSMPGFLLNTDLLPAVHWHAWLRLALRLFPNVTWMCVDLPKDVSYPLQRTGTQLQVLNLRQKMSDASSIPQTDEFLHRYDLSRLLCLTIDSRLPSAPQQQRTTFKLRQYSIPLRRLKVRYRGNFPHPAGLVLASTGLVMLELTGGATPGIPHFPDFERLTSVAQYWSRSVRRFKFMLDDLAEVLPHHRTSLQGYRRTFRYPLDWARYHLPQCASYCIADMFFSKMIPAVNQLPPSCTHFELQCMFKPDLDLIWALREHPTLERITVSLSTPDHPAYDQLEEWFLPERATLVFRNWEHRVFWTAGDAVHSR